MTKYINATVILLALNQRSSFERRLWNSSLLDNIDYQYFAETSKIIIGRSDLTALLLAVSNLSLPAAFYGFSASVN